MSNELPKVVLPEAVGAAGYIINDVLIDTQIKNYILDKELEKVKFPYSISYLLNNFSITLDNGLKTHDNRIDDILTEDPLEPKKSIVDRFVTDRMVVKSEVRFGYGGGAAAGDDFQLPDD